MRRNYGLEEENPQEIPVDEYTEFRKTIQPDLSEVNGADLL